MRMSKKRFVLVALFIFPLLFFLVLSTGINNFNRLPVLTENINQIEDIQNSNQLLKNQVTVLCFLGKNMDKNKGSFFNLNQKIYKEFYGFRSFQLLAIYPKGLSDEAQKLQSKIGAFTDMDKWKFVELSDEVIISLFQSLQTTDSLDSNMFSNKAYIIDKSLNLRGRNDDKDSEDGKLYGYNMQSVAELNNKMKDDIKVLLYEYRGAFKNKKKADRKEVGL